jgi:hypothetical protein
MVSGDPSWRDFWRAEPGERFARRHQRLGERARGPARRLLRIVAGVALVALGLVFMVLPGPGIVAALAGLALLAGESRRIAGWLDRAELKIRGRLR